MKRGRFSIILVLFLWAAFSRGTVFADEATGRYIPGALGDFLDISSEQGWSLLDWYNHFGDSLGGILAKSVSATNDAEMAVAIYTFPCAIWGSRFSPVIGRAGGRFTSTNLVGDIAIVPFRLGWKSNDFKWGFQLDVYAPTGQYDAGQLANPGLNYWTLEPLVSFSYLSRDTGLELSTTAGVDFNTKNNATDYQSGSVFHLDATVAEHLPVCDLGLFGAGVNAIYWRQFSPDSGSGAKLGSLETLIAGIGPIFSYVSPKFYGNHTVIVEVTWLPDLDCSGALDGDYVWFKAACEF